MNWKYILLSLTVLLMWGCNDDLLYSNEPGGPDAEGETIQAFLSLSVNDFTVTTDGTRDSEPSETNEEASEYENRIDNVWVFQYRASDGTKLSAKYYIITDQTTLEKLPVDLVEGVQSYFCVVANTGDDKWLVGRDFSTFSKMKDQTLSSPEPIMFSDPKTTPRPIPMEGSTERVIVKTGSVIKVPVTRMFAKIKISFDTHALDMTPKSIEINNIPYYCKVKSLAEGLAEKDTAAYDKNVQWITRSYVTTSIANLNEYIVYVPENLHGEVENKFDVKDSVAPSKALVVRAAMNYQFEETHPDKGFKIILDEERNYTVYPGGNIKTNFNIKRNNAYRVKLNVYDAEQHTPSSNCFVIEPGKGYAFEPYYRLEKGGDYVFKNYLDPKGETGEKIVRADIIWQTYNAIGSNVNGDKVWFKINEKDPIHSKIVVKTEKEGNALIGAYNANGEIIWSWHLWIRKDDPSNVGNAIVYTTYSWDKNGINANQNQRIQGYAIMPCNLGALSNAPEDQSNEMTADDWYCKEYRTYGMLYQWGRKDPFPPLKRNLDKSGTYNYDNNYVRVFDRSNSLIKMSTDGYVSSENELFNTILSNNSIIGNTFASGIKYSINHPTIHIAGAVSLSTYTWNDPANYKHKGNWLPVSDEKLWGGIPINNSTEHFTAYTLSTDEKRAIWRNYGPYKTIFDPCPSGWRVPPGDLWLGFTYNGKNVDWGSSDENMKSWLNVPPNFNISYMTTNPGYWICLDGWHTAASSGHTFFPTQGSRLASGQPLHGGICGNYHNATVDNSDTRIQRVNILHFHRSNKVNTFEDQVLYFNKSVAGPIRCVRDRK